MKKSVPFESLEPKLAELIAIKKLLVFALIKSGTSQEQIAAVLNTSQSSVSKLFGKGAFDDKKRK
jgi:predicted XRE-type DNA-binding protein